MLHEPLSTVFPDLADDTRELLIQILTGTITVGRCICHTWYDKDTGTKTIYSGKVEKMKKRNRNKWYKIAYWLAEETYADATDYDIP